MTLIIISDYYIDNFELIISYNEHEISQWFMFYDANNDGFISSEKLRVGLANIKRLTTSDIDNIIHLLNM